MANDGDTDNPDQDIAKPSMWGGRFSEPTDEFVARFTASVDVDRRLYHQDIQGSIAHANVLASAGALTPADRDAIVDGLSTIRTEIERGEFEWDRALEDVSYEHRSTAHRTHRRCRQAIAYGSFEKRPGGHGRAPLVAKPH